MLRRPSDVSRQICGRRSIAQMLCLSRAYDSWTFFITIISSSGLHTFCYTLYIEYSWKVGQSIALKPNRELVEVLSDGIEWFRVMYRAMNTAIYMF